jgi:tetratricopeptide (TPR) repeat protein
MHLRSCSIIAAFAALSLFAGCQTIQTHERPAPSTRPQEAPAPAYYYYLVAQQTLKQGDVNEAVWLMEKAMAHDPASFFLKLETANLLLLLKKSDKALNLLNDVLATDPGHVPALALAGRILQQQEKVAPAKALFEKALAAGAVDQNIYLLLGRIYWNENDWDNALRIFSQQAKHFPDSFAAHYYLGKVLITQGKWVAAENAMLQSLKLEPSLEEPRQELIKIYQVQKRPADVSRLYREILEQNPNDFGAALELALHYRQIERPAEANRLLHNLGRLSRDEEEIITIVYERFLQNKQYETGVWILNGLLQGAPEHSDLHYLTGVAYDGIKSHTEALEHLGEVVQGTRFHSNAVIHMALLQHDMGKIDQAIATMEEAIETKSDHVDFFYYLGTFYEDIERYGDALETLERGLSIDDRNQRLHFRRGVIFDKMGRKPESITAMKTVLVLKPDDAIALNYLGYTYAEMGINLDEAEQLIKKAMKIKPDDGYITDSLGWVYYKRGQYNQALNYLNKAAMLVPNDPTILEHLGDVYKKLNRPSKALEYYRRSLENDPKEKQVIEDKIRQLEQYAN